MNDPSRFESLEEDDRAVPGPAALLVSGFESDAAALVSALLATLGVSGLRVILVTREMLDEALAAALSAGAQGEPLPAGALPRVVIFSGLSGRQIHSIIDAWPETRLQRPIFASTTPTNLGVVVRNLLRELLSEQRALFGRSPGAPPASPKT